MVGIQHITQKRRVLTLMILVSVLLVGTPLFAFAALTSFQEWVLGFSMGTGGFFAGVGGLLLDKTVTFFILQMGDWFVNKGVGAVVTSVWMMIRDLFNILFIFTLVYIGLRTILNSEDSGTKKMLGMLIAAALLINFSLYIAKVVVDVANFTAVQVYTTATSGITGTYGLDYVYNGAGGGILSEEKSLAGAYMQVLDISGWFSTGVIGDRIYTYSLIMLFFLMFLGFVFAYGAIMLTTRFIAIIFYLMFSPFMFLGWILPQFQQYATKWWKGFIGYSFYAPIYLFMLYIGLYSLQQIKTGLGIQPGKSYGAAFEGTSSFSDSTMSVFLLFVIGTGFLVGAMKVAGIVSGGGAAIGMGAFDKFSRKWTTGIGSYSASRAGALGKYSAGYFASAGTGALARKTGSWMDERSAKSGKPRGRISRAIRSGVLRGETTKMGGTQSSKERIDADKAEARRHSTAHGAHETQQKIIKGSVIERESAIAGASDSTLTEMAKTKEGRTALMQAAGSLKESQVQALLKSDDIPPETKKKIKTARKEHTINRIKDGKTFQEGLKNASTAQLTSLDFAKDLLPHAMYLQESQMDNLKKKWDDNETFRILKKERDDKLKAGAIDEILKTRKGPKEIAKLPKEILESDVFAFQAKTQSILNAGLLRSISSESSANKKKIGTNIRKLYATTGTDLPPDIKKYFDSAQGADYAV